MRHHCVERLRVDRDTSLSAVVGHRHRGSASAAKRRDDLADPLDRCDQGIGLLLRARLEARQQLRDARHGGAHRGQHVPLELGVVGVSLGIGEQHAELTGDILDVVYDEGKALAILPQLTRLLQHLSDALLSHPPGHLTADHPQQLEHLAIQLERRARLRQHNESEQCAKVIEWDGQPDPRQPGQPSPCLRDRVEVDNPVAITKRRDQGMAGRYRVNSRRQVPGSGPVERDCLGVAYEEGTGWAVNDLRQGAHRPRMQADIRLGCRQRLDAAHPLAPVVVTQAKEMIDHEGPQARTSRPRREQNRHRQQATEDECDLGDPPPFGTGAANDFADGGETQQEHTADHQRGAVEHRLPRDVDVDVPAPVARGGQGDQRCRKRSDGRPADEQFGREPPEQRRIRVQ